MADPTSVQTAATATQLASDGTLSSAIQIAGATIASIIALAFPIMKLVRVYSSDKVASQKDSSESFLYQHLKEQIEQNKIELESAKEENKRLWNIIHELESRLKRLEQFEESYDRLKRKLDVKDEEIAIRDKKIDFLEAEVQKRDLQICSLTGRMAALEERLDKDEVIIGEVKCST